MGRDSPGSGTAGVEPPGEREWPTWPSSARRVGWRNEESAEHMTNTTDEMRQRMTLEDLAEWDTIQEWKATQISSGRPRVISQRIRSFVLAPVKKTAEVARTVPVGATLIGATESGALALMNRATSAAESSIRRGRITKAYRKAGHDVECLEDIRALSPDEIRAVKPHLKAGYCAIAATEGGISGLFTSGGSVAAVLGLGIASAPGVGVTLAAISLDVITFLASSSRLVSHTAAYYGYDTQDPSEALFATMVISQAIAPASMGDDYVVEKETSMLAFNKVMRKLAKRGSMDTVGNNAVTASVNSLFAALGARLLGRKLAQIVPVVGIIVGVALNASLIRTIGVTADYLYRERLLMERYEQGDGAAEGQADVSEADGPQDLDEDIARYIELAEAKGRF